MDPIIASIITGLVVSIVSGAIMALMKRRWDKKDIKQAQLDDLLEQIKINQRSIWRVNKTVLIMAKIIDDQTDKVHSELGSSLEDIATELLREEPDADKG